MDFRQEWEAITAQCLRDAACVSVEGFHQCDGLMLAGCAIWYLSHTPEVLKPMTGIFMLWLSGCVVKDRIYGKNRRIEIKMSSWLAIGEKKSFHSFPAQPWMFNSYH